ncbi:unnamed protein product [Amoebophrya sp. A120]|nr:unnamed protein product [Amoebophrya sp. A120]|eukprot:GSA120T00015337001.1
MEYRALLWRATTYANVCHDECNRKNYQERYSAWHIHDFSRKQATTSLRNIKKAPLGQRERSRERKGRNKRRIHMRRSCAVRLLQFVSCVRQSKAISSKSMTGAAAITIQKVAFQPATSSADPSLRGCSAKHQSRAGLAQYCCCSTVVLAPSLFPGASCL